MLQNYMSIRRITRQSYKSAQHKTTSLRLRQWTSDYTWHQLEMSNNDIQWIKDTGLHTVNEFNLELMPFKLKNNLIEDLKTHCAKVFTVVLTAAQIQTALLQNASNSICFVGSNSSYFIARRHHKSHHMQKPSHVLYLCVRVVYTICDVLLVSEPGHILCASARCFQVI